MMLFLEETGDYRKLSAGWQTSEPKDPKKPAFKFKISGL
jgi:hypothetical protein